MTHQCIEDGRKGFADFRHLKDVRRVQVEPVLSFGGDNHRCRLVGMEIAVSLTISLRTLSLVPAAQTMISGSEDRSMCFLSST